jgi:hypothetical protein
MVSFPDDPLFLTSINYLYTVGNNYLECISREHLNLTSLEQLVIFHEYLTNFYKCAKLLLFAIISPLFPSIISHGCNWSHIEGRYCEYNEKNILNCVKCKYTMIKSW